MVDESSVAAGKRFSRDMRLIREAREASIDSIHKETRISQSLLESFEQGGLYDHPSFNEVYLRSFVRAYAQAVEISPEVALDGLDAALEGTYESALADRYLESRPGEDDAASDAEAETKASDESTSGVPASEMKPDGPQSETPSAGGPEGRGGIVGPPRAMDDEASEAEGDQELQSSSVQETPESEKGPPVPTNVPDSEGPSDASEATPSSSTSEAAPDSEAEADEQDETDEQDEEATDDESEEVSESGGTPAWMDERPEEEAEQAPTPAGEGASSQPVQEGGGPPLQEGVGETGIVGEPTAVGSEEGPVEGGRSGASASASRDSQHRSGWLSFLQGDQREMVWAGLGIVIVLLVFVGLGIAYFSSETEPSPAPDDRQAAASSEPDTAAASPEDTTTTPSRRPPANVTLGETIHLTVRATAPVTGIRIRRDQDLERPYWIEEGEAKVFPFQQRVTLEEELADIEVFLAGYPYRGGRLDTTGPTVITRSQADAFVDTLRGTPPTLDVTPDTIPKGPPDQVDATENDSV